MRDANLDQSFRMVAESEIKPLTSGL